MNQIKDRSDYHVRAVERALAILDCFSDASPYLGVTEIAQMVGLHKSTVHALLITMEDAGYIAQNAESGKYFLTYHLFKLGSIVSNNINLKSIALPIMTELCKLTGESVALNVNHKMKRLVLAVVENPEPVRLFLREGQELYLHASAAGKVLLAGMDDVEIARYAEEKGLKSVTPNTITDFGVLEQEIDTIRQNGYALCNGEGYWEAGSVSVAIKDHKSNVIASLAIYGPLVHYTGDRLEEYIRLTKDCANKISALLGYQF